MILSMVSLKGGVGKSTLGISLAVEWARKGRSVALCDADGPQFTSVCWNAVRSSSDEAKDCPAPSRVEKVEEDSASSLHLKLTELAQSHDIVICDTPGRSSKAQRAAMLASDLVLLPCSGSGPDIWALEIPIKKLKMAQQMKPGLWMGVCLSSMDSTNMSKEGRRAIEAFGVPVLANWTSALTAYKEAITYGYGPTTYLPGVKKTAKCAAEVEAIAVELENLYAAIAGVNKVATTGMAVPAKNIEAAAHAV